MCLQSNYVELGKPQVSGVYLYNRERERGREEEREKKREREIERERSWEGVKKKRRKNIGQTQSDRKKDTL